MKKKTTTKKIKEVKELSLTKTELKHLRDMLSVVLPPDGAKTISESLAQKTNRTISEKSLWKKIANLCADFDIATGEKAPNYLVTVSGPAPIDVFKLIDDAEV